MQSVQRSIETIVLGTVQFGAHYGVANSTGKPGIGEVKDILDLAYEKGIRILDTAMAYGNSEEVLGKCGMDRWSLITKVPSLHSVDDCDIEKVAYEKVMRSLNLLRTESLHAVLLHDHHDAAGDRGRRLYDALMPFVDKGQIGKLGVSIYRPEDMAGIAASNAQIVQAPLNVFDQSMISSGAAVRLQEAEGELHVRSVFLQGLLLIPVEKRPARFAPWASHFSHLDKLIGESGLDPAAFCLGFVASQPAVSRCVIGVETAAQLAEVVQAFEVGKLARFEAHELKSQDPGLIDPRQWGPAS